MSLVVEAAEQGFDVRWAPGVSVRAVMTRKISSLDLPPGMLTTARRAAMLARNGAPARSLRSSSVEWRRRRQPADLLDAGEDQQRAKD